MSFRVKTLAEPFSEHAKAEPPILAQSAEYQRLRFDLERYTKGEILGRSYLIGGHRGSGKTMMVHHAIEELIRRSQGLPNRPLFVRLHGPDLLPPILLEEKQSEAPPASPAAADAAAKEDKAAAPTPGTKPDATKKPAPAAKPRTADETELEAVLIQMVKALYRHVSSEYRRCYREEILRRSDSVVRDDLLEVAAQFDFELTDYVTPARLRTFWHRINAFRRGILFNVDRSAYKVYSPSAPESASGDLSTPSPMVATDTGLQEILVLSALSEAYRITSGKLEDISRRLSSDKDTRSSSISTAYELKNLLAPVAGLLSGGFVGVSVGSTNPFAAVLLGLLTGGIVSLVFSYKSERTRNREDTLESIFTKDRSVTTLSSVVPLLVDRLKMIGLAPIFVIDELDKVENLESRMTNLVRHLKFLVTENSFSCFLVDRRYFTYLDRQSTQSAYAKEYTYFSNRLLVVYSPAELRNFVTKAIGFVAGGVPITALPAAEKQELDKLSYVLLFRARMHPIDLRRQLDNLTGTFALAERLPSPRYRFEILIQVAIEWLLDGDDVKTRLNGSPHYRQVIYDAMYYVPRLWEDAGSDNPQVPGFYDFRTNEKERKPGLVLDESKFAEYLESRIAVEDRPKNSSQPKVAGKGPRAAARLSGKDFEFLMSKIQELLRFLCHPQQLIAEMQRGPRTPPPDFILNEIPDERAFRLMIQKNNEPRYQWLYDVSGSYLRTREAEEIIREAGDAVTYIRTFMADLAEVGITGDLQTLATLNIIPRPSELEQRVIPALNRLDELSAGGNDYPDMSVDADVVQEFKTTLQDFEPNISAALLCAAVFAPEISLSLPTPGLRLTVALREVSQALKLTAVPEDLAKLKYLLSSVPGPPLDPEKPFDEIINVVSQRAKADKATDETANIIVADAWGRYRDRFSKHFQEGTTKFDTDYFDVFTFIRKGPGGELNSDFSAITARVWSKQLLLSLLENELPPWMPVAAALKLGLFELAEKLAVKSGTSDPLMGQWVEDTHRWLKTDTQRTNALIIRLEQMSTPDSWHVSLTNGAAIFAINEVASFLKELKRLQIATLAADYHLQLIAIELPAKTEMLSKVASLSPARALTTISSMSPPKELEELLKTCKLSYFVTEPITNIPTGSIPIVVAPKTIDELIEVSLRSPSTTPTP